MLRTREKLLQERRRLRAECGYLLDSVAALIFRRDPIGIAFESENTDKHASDTGTILPLLRGCESASNVRRVVHEEFVRWFDAETGGPEQLYSEIPFGDWQLWPSLSRWHARGGFAQLTIKQRNSDRELTG
jgi:hypothetical protein